MNKETKTGLGCMFLAAVMLAEAFASVAVGFMFGAGWGFVLMAAFMALLALLVSCVYRSESKKGVFDER